MVEDDKQQIRDKQQVRLGAWANPKYAFTDADVQWLENMQKIHGKDFGRNKLTPKPAQPGKPLVD